MVLYVTQKGFRFPYPRWTDISAAANGRFLETQLDQYLHRHYEDGGVLYTEQTGFRVPRKHGLDSLEENMRFVEAQLDEYLHEHDASVGAGTTTIWDNNELMNGRGPNGNEIPVTRFIEATTWYTFWPSGGYSSSLLADDINMAESYYVHGANPSFDGYWVVSATNPHTGTYHWRATTDYDTNFSTAGPFMNIGTEITDTNSFIAGYTGIPIVAGDYTWTMYAMQSGSSESANEKMNRLVRLVDANDSTSATLYSDLVPYPTSYELMTIEFTITEAHVAEYTHFYIGFDWDDERLTEPIGEIRHFDIDELKLVRDGGATTLHVKPRGFRFPYDWQRPDAIDHNRRFLETELSTYLHIHEGS